MSYLMYIILALIAVESNGDRQAVGDDGRAVGVLQCHKVVVDDVNRIAGTAFTYDDRLDYNKSVEICGIYLTHYVTKERLGHTPTEEDYARCWNGGPSGYKEAHTEGYWLKVQQQLGVVL